jgi:exosortase/archaeosortase family protein
LNVFRRIADLMKAPTALGFAARLVLFWSPLVGFFAIGPIRVAIEEPLTRGYTAAVSALLTLLGESHRVEGAVIISASYRQSLEIASVCTGYFVFWFYLGAVLAFPATWRSRLRAIVLGVLFIAGLNLVRIVSLYYLQVVAPALFDELHLVVWQCLSIVLISVFWYGWASRRSSITTAPTESAPAA